MSVETGNRGVPVIICWDGQNRSLVLPASADFPVLPLMGPPIHQPRSRPTSAPPSRDDENSELYDVSLESLLESLGELPLQQRIVAGDSVDTIVQVTIKEGFLSKLPPVGNTLVAWKRRWFKLMLNLTQSSDECALVLQYYEKPNSAKPKGAINLDHVTFVGDVDLTELQQLKVLKNVAKVSIIPGVVVVVV